MTYENRDKIRRIAYWTFTALVALSFLSGGVGDLVAPAAIAGVRALGYPAHFVTLLGVWKILGACAVVTPGLPRLKEWAYAGMIFDLTGAAVAHASTGDADAWMGNAGHIAAPLLIAVLVVASWMLRPGSAGARQGSQVPGNRGVRVLAND
jgi:hypothetical protein